MAGEEIVVEQAALVVEVALGHLEHLGGDQLQRGLVDGGEEAVTGGANGGEFGAVIAEERNGAGAALEDAEGQAALDRLRVGDLDLEFSGAEETAPTLRRHMSGVGVDEVGALGQGGADFRFVGVGFHAVAR